MNRSHKRPIIFAVREFPPCCGTRRSNVSSRLKLPQRPFKNPRRSYDDDDDDDDDDVASASKPKVSCLKQEPKMARDYGHGHHDVAAAASKPQGSCLKQDSEVKDYYHGRHVAAAAHKQKGPCLKQEPVMKNYNAPRDFKQKGACFEQESPSDEDDDPIAREKVLEVRRVFNEVFKDLDRDKQARRGGDMFIATSRIDLKTQAVLEKMGKRVNSEKRIGSVPGIRVGDVFQYKTELRVVGLHFKPMCGIDYMKIGDVKLATSIVASEGYGYVDKFDSNVVIYTGEGGNVISKEKETEDQKLEKGNLALVNSMRQKRPVRVIRGEERLDRKGKRYVYAGLYMVEKYWLEKEARGKTVYKFKLCKT
ncbi:unnamed protein product [Cochlearia groenlandica]